MRKDFQFVEVVATKDGRAKPSKQALVRKNAAHYQWRGSKTSKSKVPVGRGLTSASSSKDRSLVLVEQNEDEEVTGPEQYGLHGSRLALQTYYLSLGPDEETVKTMTFSKSLPFLEM